MMNEDHAVIHEENFNLPARDISLTLISEESILQKLPGILVDSIVVDQCFNIRVISQNVLDSLEFRIEELKGKSLNYLTGGFDLVSKLKSELTSGYFEEYLAALYNKGNIKIDVSVAGFYLGLIVDYNDHILLRVKDLCEVERIQQQIQVKKVELDNFIYRTSHDLRGPLATIKGLLNLVKMRKNEEDLDRLVSLLDAHANKMDERLFQLVYWAQADMESDPPTHVVDFSSLETMLRKIIEQNAFVDFLELHFAAPFEKVKGPNEVQIKSLLSNLLMYILSLPMNNRQNQIFFNIMRDGDYLKVTVGVVGFSLNEELRKAMRQHELIYTDMVNYPQLIHFYSAQKIVWTLNGRLRMNFIADDKQRISILLPMSKGPSR